MARKIRFPLNMKDGAAVRTIEELREHFDLESVLGYFADGKLITWLERAYCDDEAKAVGQLTADMPDLAEKLCGFLGVEYKADAESVDIEAIRKKEEQLRLLSSVTTDPEILDNIDLVAADQNELLDILANSPAAVYLCGEQFSVPLSKKNIRYAGVNQPKVMLEKGKLLADYRAAGITFKDVRYVSPYHTEAEQVYLAERYAEAFPLLQDAADKSNPRAMYMIAMCYFDGHGIEAERSKCKEWLERAYGMKEPLSSMNYAYHCCAGDKERETQILSEYAEELRALAFSGDYLAQFEYYNYVLSYNVVQDCSKALEWCRKAAEQGNSAAQHMFGSCCYTGKCVEQDYAKAAEWYRKAAEQGYAAAQNNLGYMYQNGQGVSQDYAKAVEWYRKAAEQGYAAAQNNLGCMYQNGRGVSQDYAKAVEWYRKAAEQGDAAAQNMLGLTYNNGNGVEQDYSKAVEWYRKAAEQGYANAQGNLGNMYYDGLGVEQDYAKAAEWFSKAAEQGHDCAQNALGFMYHNGQGVEQDYAKAVAWYRKAAEQGYANAQCNLGYMYENGQGVSEDGAMAEEWYRKAAEQGNDRAQRNLMSLIIRRYS